MHYIRAMLFGAVIAATGTLATQFAFAAGRSHFAIMGLRLHMSAQEVLEVLYAQGIREDGVREHVHPCALHAAAACTGSITARLPDGPITVRFADAPPTLVRGGRQRSASSIALLAARGTWRIYAA